MRDAMGRTFYCLAVSSLIAGLAAAVALRAQGQAAPTTLRFEVTAAKSLGLKAVDGRLFIVLGKTETPEPRTAIGRPGMNTAPFFAVDARGFDGTRAVVVDQKAASYPLAGIGNVPAGDYVAQALLDTNVDLKSINAPGNMFSAPLKVRIDPAAGGVITLELSARVPDETLPPSSDMVKFVKMQSKLLSAFWGRPIYLRAGIVLPRDFEKNPTRKYPLRVRIGGYGASYTGVQRLMADNGEFKKVWMADDTPRMVLLHLDGDGPLGDPYQVDSDNHGPYGAAITQELIPYVEREFRAAGDGRSRVLDGGSTGGWVSLALQVFYPDFFNGTWSSCPDGVDFRGFQLVNIYEDANAYVNKTGFERPSMREINGDVAFTMRNEVQLENVIGLGDSWTMSGQQWGAWNATYGPKGSDGRPAALWDPKSGAINKSVTDHWKKYDLRMHIEQNWAALQPKLAGKIHIDMGDADNYFLNNAARMLETFFQNAKPASDARMRFAPMRGHCYTSISAVEMMKEMATRTGATP